MQAGHFLDPQIHSKSFVNSRPICDRKLTFNDRASQFFTGGQDDYARARWHSLRNRRSGLIYCNVTDTCCFLRNNICIQTTCITVYVYNQLK